MPRPPSQGQWTGFPEAIADKQVLVLGLGRFGGGVDAVRYLAARAKKVVVSDAAPASTLAQSLAQLEGLENIELHLGGHRDQDIHEADLIVVNPAVPDDSPHLHLAASLHRPVTTAVNIFFQQCPARIIGITGSNGKSTTAALAAFLLDRARTDRTRYGRVWLSGNIGNTPLLESLPQIQPQDLVVLELSSFQIPYLDGIGMGPAVALLTNLTPNHLDRHKTFEAYCRAKQYLFSLQPLDPDTPAISIFPAHDQVGIQWYKLYKGQVGRVCLTFDPDRLPLQCRQALPLPGRANLANLAAAMCIAGCFGVTAGPASEVLPGFRGLAHRLEYVATIDGVDYYDDSIATTPESAMAALEAFDRPKVIIAGGSDKGLCYEAFGWAVARRAKAAVLVGATAQRIAQAISASDQVNASVVHAQTFEQAVRLAKEAAEPGDVVLLSPASASFDMFENFHQRGLEFARLVRKLAQE